jgi:hypothetical protein
MFSFYKKKLFTPNGIINKYALDYTNDSMRKKIIFYNNEKTLKKYLNFEENQNYGFNVSTSAPSLPSNFFCGSLFLLFFTYFFYYKYNNKLIYK